MKGCKTFEQYETATAREADKRAARSPRTRKAQERDDFMVAWADMMEDRTRSNRRRMSHW